MQARRPTIDDVARHSGVGRTTVSRVLNDGPNVRPEVRDRVWASVRSLNYSVNPQARSLASGSSGLIALVFASDFDAQPNSFYASALELGALRECLVQGRHLLTHHVPQHSPDWKRQVLELIRTQRCQGVVLTPPFSDDPDLVKAATAQCAVALISPSPSTRGLADGVGVDDEAGGYDVARHLLGLGHRNLAYITGLESHLSAARRLEGLRRAVKSQGLDPASVRVLGGDFTFRSGVEHTRRLLGERTPPTAIICANDDTAAGALSVAHGLHLSVPDELSITGFDDTPMSEIVWPPLTTVHQPLKDMAGAAVSAIARRLAGEEDGPRFETLPHRVIARESSGPPGAP
ncbi:LacI family DNA-binding transcriptional regulator [uncultured Brevundimonas sp.]|uniref:LacI family DNA-binding transcriptional regulator n=1 Tax=uncultured Brevundimonas sp. TaxID=213418 RepID=UPI002595F483|nr:LacI family DNA-binding transcriptional regulator [uncultured Brevundimonas sp.]